MDTERLDTLRERFARTTDRLGQPIDPGIFETVVQLNALGFPTTASCEGHLYEGLPTPWVDIAVPVPEHECMQAVLALSKAEKAQESPQEKERLLNEAQHRFFEPA